MSKSINILGDTPKEMWLSAIMIFEMAITSNVRYVQDEIDHGAEDPLGAESHECLDRALKQTRDFADEMRRLVEGVFE